jgi:hypothetical protein
MVGLHDAIEIIGPLILQREEVKGHALATIDDLLVGESGLGFIVIERKLTVANLVCLFHDLKCWVWGCE